MNSRLQAVPSGGKRGDVFLVMIGIAIAVIFAFAFFYYSFNKGLNRFMQGPSFDPRMLAVVEDWKRVAPLVIIGRIDDSREVVNEKAENQTQMVMSYCVMDVHVDLIERGQYPEEDITVYFGWYSSDADGESVPLSLVQDYQTGDRVRLWLGFDKEQYGWYTPWSYYTIEKLPSS